MTAQYVGAATATVAAAAATTAVTLFADMLEKLGKIYTCEVVIMYQMLRKRRQTNLFGNIFLINTKVSYESHFKMELVQIFSKPLRRKADEGVRIYHLDADNRMNSKNEFMQGTNLYLQPVRGLGV